MSITHPHSMPAPILPRSKSWLFDSFKRFHNWRKQRRQRRIDRQAFQQLLYLDHRLLRDAGYERSDLEDASNLPMNVDATAAVNMLKNKRRRQH